MKKKLFLTTILILVLTLLFSLPLCACSSDKKEDGGTVETDEYAILTFDTVISILQAEEYSPVISPESYYAQTDGCDGQFNANNGDHTLVGNHFTTIAAAKAFYDTSVATLDDFYQQLPIDHEPAPYGYLQAGKWVFLGSSNQAVANDLAMLMEKAAE